MQMAPSSRQDMDSIPVIDISPFIHQTAGNDAVVKAIEAACRETGFFLITGHGVSAEATAQLYNLARDFFDEPQDWKKQQGRGTSLKGASLSPPSRMKH